MDEYIKREAAIGAAKHAWAKGLEPSQYIEIIPAADVEPVRPGRWVQQPLNGTHIWRCSKCETIGSPQWNYCPKCGAKMGDKLYG